MLDLEANPNHTPDMGQWWGGGCPLSLWAGLGEGRRNSLGVEDGVAGQVGRKSRCSQV